ncbi:aminodeoxychorismate synthase component I [Clostridium cibarium]|uniref:Anthranilate synthase component 1 n=1 Tax=Clostridium cibarium TaxID=2762247 RepID=A0ABR8PP27_9CLOT|nr:aminodeoxychorismate synthase component I [Clostridium cibarium]MBD7909923.1 aminodeoxychorismate synthase component I [Clostridium cibarium]
MRIKELENYYNPLDVYRIFKDEKDSVFLDSSKEGSPFSLFSFIGINPLWKFESIGKSSYLDGEKLKGEDPFKNLEKLLGDRKIKEKSNLPFIGGVIGYFSYDIGRDLEDLPSIAIEDFYVPDSKFLLYENIIIFDLIEKKTYISALSGDKSIRAVEEKLKCYKEQEEIGFKEKNTRFYSNFTKEEYKKRITRLKEYIRSGDVYIANMTRRIWCETSEPAFEMYEKLRSINKAPFSAFMNFEDFQVVSSSPERFLSIKDRKVTTRPIKGTRPRGRNEEEDNYYREELINSEKDKSELLMIVDLERNDLSKTCKPNTVKVTELFKIEKYSTVFHLVSTVEGILKNGISSIECLKECFPGGSITGAPKIRAMEIIEELEELKRNLYTGAIGYFDLRGNCDFNIIIRTIIKKGDKAYFGVGGGITWDSIEEDEWCETCDKAKALMKVL